MKTEKSAIPVDVLKNFDIIYGLNGGISQTRTDWKESAEDFKFYIHTPGTVNEDFGLDVKNNNLLVYNLVTVKENDEFQKVPVMVRSYKLPHFADKEKISASFKDGTLEVTVPFNKQEKGFERNIPII
jgi:HSP20 family molecular chaperone IbpA